MNPPPPLPPVVPQKKGLSGLAIAGIGCGALLLIGAIGAVVAVWTFAPKAKKLADDFKNNPAKAAAMLAVKANPDLDLVNSDDAKGEITVRDKKSGKEVTMSFDEISQGKFRMRNADGEEVTIDGKAGPDGGRIVVKGPDGQTVIGGDAGAIAPPDWVPAYPGAKPQGGGMKKDTANKVNGMFVGETGDGTAKVREFYETKLKAAGFETEATTSAVESSDSAVVTGRKDGGKRTLNVMLNTDKGVTTIVITYEGAKP